MNPVLLQPGCAYSFDYPRHNYRLLPATIETRRIVVNAIRDTFDEPLDRTTASLNPLLHRGRWLVTGLDLDKDATRSFYSESMTNIRTLSQEDLQPLKGVEYVVIDLLHVTFKTQQLNEALAFRTSHERGAICAVLSSGPREIDLNEDNEDGWWDVDPNIDTSSA